MPKTKLAITIKEEAESTDQTLWVWFNKLGESERLCASTPPKEGFEKGVIPSDLEAVYQQLYDKGEHFISALGFETYTLLMNEARHMWSCAGKISRIMSSFLNYLTNWA